MHELNIKDVFPTERLRQMSTATAEQASSSRHHRAEKSSIKAGMEALMKELLGQTGLSDPQNDTVPFDPEHIVH